MHTLLQDLRHLWKLKPAFRIASVYLILWVVLSLFLPLLPLVYEPNSLDLNNIMQPPFQNNPSQPTHYLGTDAIGRDVLSNVLYGARTGFFIGVPVMLLASVIGVILGAAAGYFGDAKLKTSMASLFALWPLTLFSLYFYGLYIPAQAATLQMPVATASISMLIFILAGAFILLRTLLNLIPSLKKQVTVPLDYIIVRLIEVVSSIPWLILVLMLASFLQPSVTMLAFILILTSWMGIARLARAEMLRIKALPYMEAATSLGLPTKRILLQHALPNMLGPILTSFTFGLASLLTIESTLSFLGIGIPPTVVSWGRLITGIRSDTSAWWLVVFPGIFLAATVLALQVFNYYLLALSANKKKA